MTNGSERYTLRFTKKVPKQTELSPFFQIDHDERKKHPIELRNASFSWHDSPNQQLQDSTLRNVTWHVPQGSLVAIVGIVGSGKSSLLSSLLGDMIRVSGDANIKG